MTVTDPVCGTQVDIEKAESREDHGGWAYFFCSERCHRLFSESPGRYAERERWFGDWSAKQIKESGHG